MADERIDIEVNDKVDTKAEKKLLAIADAAERGETYLNRLKTALASVNSSSVDRLASAMAKADSAQARLLNAQARLTSAQNAGSIAASKVALSTQKIATESARTEAAQARAAAATSAAESAALRLAATQARLAGTSNTAASAEDQLALAVSTAKARFDAGEISIRGYVMALQQAESAALAAGAAGTRLGQGIDTPANAMNGYNRSARQMNAANANIIAQMNDIGVSLAGGQNPLLVLIQQGSQLEYIASTMDGGVKALIATMLRMIAPFAAAAAVVGVLAVKMAMFKNELNDNSDIDQFVKDLGLTKKEMKELGDTAITWGDLFTGVMTTVKDGLSGVAPYWDMFKEWGASAVSFVWDVLKNFAFGMVGLMHGAFTLVKGVWSNLGPLMGEIAIGAANATIGAIEWMVNKAIQGINILSDAANSVLAASGLDMFGSFGKVAEVTFGRIENKWAGTASKIGSDTANAAIDGFKGAELGYNKFVDAVGRNSDAARKKRLTDEANKLKEKRPDGKGAGDKKAGVDKEAQAAERRAQALKLVNMELDNELGRMGKLKLEREIADRMDTISEQLARKKITLSQEEALAIEGKVRAIKAFATVQQEMDRIYEDVTAPAQVYNDTLKAAKILLDGGKISLERYNQELTKAKMGFEEATDPAYAFQQAIDSTKRTMGFYGEALERANYLESIRQEYAKEGINIDTTSNAAIKAKVASLVAQNNAMREQQLIQEGLAAVLNPILQQDAELANKQFYYDELQRLRETDKANEASYQRAKWALDAKFNEMRLQSASDFFGTLAGITANGNGAIGAISKAAAVAQATMDGFVAAQKALASAPPPFNYIAAAAVALKTGANVAGILSTNAGSFATGGQFMVDGKSGVDANNINMNVTKGERVTIETPAQQRAADAAGGAGVELNQKILNLFDEKSFISAMDSDEGEDVIMNIITRRKQDVAAITGNPNG